MTRASTRRLRRRGPPSQEGMEYIVALTMVWCGNLWRAMQITGNGYPRVKVKRKPRVGKLPKALRGVRIRGLVADHKPARPWVTMSSRVNGDVLRRAKREGRTVTQVEFLQ